MKQMIKLITAIKIAIIIVLMAGWIQGLIKFVNCDFESGYKAEIVYGLGTVTGYNGIVGWFDIGEFKNKEG